MGTPAGFEEKEFEVLANASFSFGAFASGSAPPVLFSPGQVLEKTLGFDFSIYLAPNSTTYKLLFGSYPGPVSPGAFAAPVALPAVARSVNTFIQYKRPTYFGPNHRQTVWPQQPFLRFDVRSRYRLNNQNITDHSQLEALDVLASQNPAVKVRYACPSVWSRNDLYTQYALQDLISNCGFTDPRNLSHSENGTHSWWHNFWTFRPANPAAGCPNPSGPRRGAQTGEGFMQEVRDEIDNQPKSDPLEDIQRIRSTAKDKLTKSKFFASDSEFRGHSKAKFIERATSSSAEDFLDAPRNENWLAHSRAIDSTRPARPPRSSEMDVIEATVEVAATAKELGLTWMAAVE